MILGSKNFVVILEAPDCDCKIEFRRPPLNTRLMLGEALVRDDSASIRPADLRKYFNLINDTIVKIEGLYAEDGSEVTLEDLKSLNVPENFMNVLTKAYWEALRAVDLEEAKKNASAETVEDSSNGSEPS